MVVLEIGKSFYEQFFLTLFATLLRNHKNYIDSIVPLGSMGSLLWYNIISYIIIDRKSHFGPVNNSFLLYTSSKLMIVFAGIRITDLWIMGQALYHWAILLYLNFWKHNTFQVNEFKLCDFIMWNQFKFMVKPFLTISKSLMHMGTKIFNKNTSKWIRKEKT